MAYEMIGRGKNLDPKSVSTKGDADHSLHYMAADSLLDGQLEPEQYEKSRIQRDDVQSPLKQGHPCPRLPKFDEVSNRDQIKKQSCHQVREACFEGFRRRPMLRQQVAGKFRGLASETLQEAKLGRIIDCVAT